MVDARDVCLEALDICAEKNTYCQTIKNEAAAMETVYRRGACYILVRKRDGTLSLMKLMVNGYARKIMEVPADILDEWLEALVKVVRGSSGEAGGVGK